jgi:Domain of unknown function (DUF1905)
VPAEKPGAGAPPRGERRVQRFTAHVAAGSGGRAVIVVPFDPDQAWGAKADHPVSGALDGRRVRGRLAPDGGGWALTLSPGWTRDGCVAVGDKVIVELAPEGLETNALRRN